MVLHPPGNSGEEVHIVSASQGMRARITLQTSSLFRTSRRLSHAHVKAQKSEETLSFSDPDGNQISVQLR